MKIVENIAGDDDCIDTPWSVYRGDNGSGRLQLSTVLMMIPCQHQLARRIAAYKYGNWFWPRSADRRRRRVGSEWSTTRSPPPTWREFWGWSTLFTRHREWLVFCFFLLDPMRCFAVLFDSHVEQMGGAPETSERDFWPLRHLTCLSISWLVVNSEPSLCRLGEQRVSVYCAG